MTLLFWLTGALIAIGVTKGHYEKIGEEPPWWTVPILLIGWPYALGYWVGFHHGR